MSGWNPPPPQGGPVPYGAPGAPPMGPPYLPPRRRSRAGCVIGVLAGGVVGVLLLCAAVYGVYLVRTDHELSTPAVAGGTTRDTAAEGRMDETVRKLRSVITRGSGYKIYDFVSAVYGSGDSRFLFVGGTGEHGNGGVVDAFNLALQEELNLGQSTVRITSSTTKISDPGGDGMAMCSHITATSATGGSTTTSDAQLCAWSTRTTLAVIMPIRGGSQRQVPSEYEGMGLQDRMRHIRADVED
ncbi:hypothetical protein AGRA3207_001722 [Actinomadura graeca]|uniref:Uncharacterized protein n=1 Tax=Actinomadura graeca TaxID=2750812 RepID=A0ABX8QQK9_9ACTN|nr:hypothetical protein [Actinomadura graeca]QXJ20925.1 hypothetical protein AGRA3207_001722 [Actinomadura graeca]